MQQLYRMHVHKHSMDTDATVDVYADANTH